MRALVTTRERGDSQPPYDCFNLAQHVGDDATRVQAHRQQLQQWVGADHPLLWLQQVHGTRVVSGDEPDLQADAAVARDGAHACIVMTADCLPVLFCSRQGNCVGAAHAGWRGLADGVLEATVNVLPAAPGELMAWLGPAIGPDAFEVGPEVRARFVSEDAAAAAAFRPSPGKPEHWLADLYQLARQRLQRIGVRAVYGGGFCTYTDAARFYSYRRDSVTGRMASVIWLD